jgi:O-antigen ligase
METTSSGGARHVDVVTGLTFFFVALFAVPPIYFIGAAGSIASPAIVLALAGLLWWGFGRILYGSGIDRGRQPIRITLLLFVGAVLISYALFNRRLQPVDWSNAADRGLVLVFALAGILLLTADGIDRTDRLMVLLRRMTFAASLVGVVGIIQYVSKQDFVSPVFDAIPGLTTNNVIAFAGRSSVYTDIRRVSGTATHPIEFGVVLAMAFPFAAHYALTDRTRSGLDRWWQVAVILIAQPMAQSRSGMLATAVAAVVLLCAWPKSAIRKILGWLPAALVALRFAFPGLLGTITGLFLHFQGDSSYTSRTEDYGNVGKYVAQYPIFGRGFGTFLPKDFFFLDNQYLMSLIDIGVVGLVALIALMVSGVLLAFRASRWAVTQERRLLARSLCGAIAGGTLTLATFDFFSFQMATGMVFVLLGCAGAMWRLFRAEALAAGYTSPPSLGRPRSIDDIVPPPPHVEDPAPRTTRAGA